MAQPEGRLPGVVTGAHELELELRLQLAHRGRRRGPDAEARLPDPGEVAVVLAELVLVGRQLRGAQRVEPVGVDLLEVVADVHHGETVDLHAGLRLGRLRRGHADRKAASVGEGHLITGLVALEVLDVLDLEYRAAAGRGPDGHLSGLRIDRLDGEGGGGLAGDAASRCACRAGDRGRRRRRGAGFAQTGHDRLEVAEGDRVADLERVEALHLGTAVHLFEETRFVPQGHDARRMVDSLDGEGRTYLFGPADGLLRRHHGRADEQDRQHGQPDECSHDVTPLECVSHLWGCRLTDRLLHWLSPKPAPCDARHRRLARSFPAAPCGWSPA